MKLLTLLVLVLMLGGCPERTSGAPTGSQTNPVAVCAKEGQSCVYSSGKLGLCTMRDETCDGSPGCFVCVSLH